MRRSAILELKVISNGARRHRVVCWLPTKWPIFDLQLTDSWGLASSWAIWEKRAGKAFPIGVGTLPQGCSHCQENVCKWPSEISLQHGSQWQTTFNGEVRESSSSVGLRTRWHITATLYAVIPRMRQSGVGKFASDQRGEGCVMVSPNAKRMMAQTLPDLYSVEDNEKPRSKNKCKVYTGISRTTLKIGFLVIAFFLFFWFISVGELVIDNPQVAISQWQRYDVTQVARSPSSFQNWRDKRMLECN